jgi:hypothetical protein
VPSWRTAVPLAPLATVVPIAERSYFTFALVAEDSETESTLDVTAAASGLAAKALIADENCEPFCSSWTRLLFGVEELKNVVQFAVISAAALDEPLGTGVELTAEDDAAVLGAAAAVEDEELEPLEQADIAVTSTRPSAGAR